MQTVQLFNSYSNRVEPLVPIRPGEVSIYVCGPTVYSFVHIGNMRPVVVFDVLKRFLIFIGYKVTHVSNITDVDDKIITAAKNEGVSEKELTTKYSEAFFESVHDLHAIPPSEVPYVTETMPQIISFIQQLVEVGFAYVVEGDVYFRVSNVKDYGKLANLQIEDLRIGARIEENKSKENPLDFTLWKKTSQGIRWSSPWSEGRPGWHTECVVMINKIFPNGRVDIHGGGFDLKFPHHENEIAQSQAIHHHSIASIWMHNGFINMGNEKMSKSLGNVKLAKDLLSNFGGNVIRMVMLTTHYRAPVNFSDEIIATAQNELNKVFIPLRQVAIRHQRFDWATLKTNWEPLMEPFLKALGDDLNTPNAMSELFTMVKELNQALRTNLVERIQLFETVILKMLGILGLTFEPPLLTKEDIELFSQWESYKAAKEFDKADVIRLELTRRNLL